MSLFHDAPVRIASLRGALAFAATLLVASAARRALERSLQRDRERGPQAATRA
jgi:hypothetical protein